MGERYLKSIRLLAECMQGFERLSGDLARAYGLTPAQFDIVATLGNTPGMAYKELGEKTLITKGTLTGVIERLEQKGLVERKRSCTDKRSFFIRLTASGERLFAHTFPHLTAQVSLAFTSFSEADFVALETILAQLKNVMVVAHGDSAATRLSITKEKY
ncbi:MAG: MarR family transcriptional regulator [Pseudomonadota bacterium]